MKKIIKSLAVVVAVGAIATGATWSFFSDEEKSTGNTFTAGKIDLKVDSEAHYNGMVCAFDEATDKYLWQDESGCSQVGDNLVERGSFETPEVQSDQHWQIFPQSAIGPWKIEGTPDSVNDLEGLEFQENGAIPGATASNGNQYVELDSYYPIKLSQKIDVAASGKYRVSFKYAPRPGHNDNKLKVTFNGNVILDTPAIPSAEPFAWTTFSEIVTIPTSGEVEISFEDTGIATDQMGMFLDDVRVYALECTEVADSEFLGKECDGTWDMADLNEAHKFFNFSDVKPGDEGEDTVSLHLSSNDAWGRMVIDVKKDSDNTCVGPELKPEDDDCSEVCDVTGCASGEGELRENLKFSVWLDQGETPGFQGKSDKGEGDNIFNEKDIALIAPGEINSDGEEWLISDAIKLAYLDNDSAVAPGITADGHMTPDVTYYFGIAWKLPSDVGNEAQTDIFEADITFEVEQYRNNPDGFEAN